MVKCCKCDKEADHIVEWNDTGVRIPYCAWCFSEDEMVLDYEDDMTPGHWYTLEDVDE